MALLLRFQEVQTSNLGPETNCADFLQGFPQTLETNAGVGSQIMSRQPSSTSFLIVPN